jgi:hypothetical protein
MKVRFFALRMRCIQIPCAGAGETGQHKHHLGNSACVHFCSRKDLRTATERFALPRWLAGFKKLVPKERI